MNPYKQLVKDPSRFAKAYSARVLNGSTFRMFGKNQSGGIRTFLVEQIGDGSELARSKDSDEYTRTLLTIVGRFQDQFRMNDGRRPNLGQAAKVVNLYVKHLIMLPNYLMPLNRRRQLERYAHVPLDGEILNRMWGDRTRRGDFRIEMEGIGISHPKLSKLKNKRDYRQIQSLLAEAARRASVPAVAYDYFWAERNE